MDVNDYLSNFQNSIAQQRIKQINEAMERFRNPAQEQAVENLKKQMDFAKSMMPPAEHLERFSKMYNAGTLEQMKKVANLPEARQAEEIKQAIESQIRFRVPQKPDWAMEALAMPDVMEDLADNIRASLVHLIQSTAEAEVNKKVDPLVKEITDVAPQIFDWIARTNVRLTRIEMHLGIIGGPENSDNLPE